MLEMNRLARAKKTKTTPMRPRPDDILRTLEETCDLYRTGATAFVNLKYRIDRAVLSLCTWARPRKAIVWS